MCDVGPPDTVFVLSPDDTHAAIVVELPSAASRCSWKTDRHSRRRRPLLRAAAAEGLARHRQLTPVPDDIAAYYRGRSSAAC
jgi:hypothetical protein